MNLIKCLKYNINFISKIETICKLKNIDISYSIISKYNIRYQQEYSIKDIYKHLFIYKYNLLYLSFVSNKSIYAQLIIYNNYIFLLFNDNNVINIRYYTRKMPINRIIYHDYKKDGLFLNYNKTYLLNSKNIRLLMKNILKKI